ncbi:hypothetical protein VD659_16235 [Herbiconiux sp. 11R-BC]|uniref:hypothetical protein n=1 Tax=Herbiconiux sp. 11R-BC TaxID=3111637 RepID=UPI003BFFAFD6
MEFVVTIILSAAGVIAAIVIPLAIYRRQTPRHELWYDYSSQSLTPVAPSPLAGRLKVEIDGHPVAEPYTLNFRIWSVGTADVRSDAFDAGSPMVISLGAVVLGQYASVSAVNAELVKHEVGTDRIVIQPSLIRRDTAMTFRLIVDGKPEVSIVSPLADVSLNHAGELEKRDHKASLYWRYPLGLGLIAAVIVTPFILGSLQVPENVIAGIAPLPIAATLTLSILIMFGNIWTTRSSRAYAARAKAIRKVKRDNVATVD